MYAGLGAGRGGVLRLVLMPIGAAGQRLRPKQIVHHADHLGSTVAGHILGLAVIPVGQLQQAGFIAQRPGIVHQISHAAVAVGHGVVGKMGPGHVFDPGAGGDDLLGPAVDVDQQIIAGALHLLEEGGQGFGFQTSHRLGPVKIPCVGQRSITGGKAPVHVDALSLDQLAGGIQVCSGAASRAVVGPAAVQAVRVHAGQHVHRPVMGVRQLTGFQMLHQLFPGVHQALAIPGKVIFIAMDREPHNQHIFSVSVTVCHQLPALAGIAIDDPLRLRQIISRQSWHSQRKHYAHRQHDCHSFFHWIFSLRIILYILPPFISPRQGFMRGIIWNSLRPTFCRQPRNKK